MTRARETAREFVAAAPVDRGAILDRLTGPELMEAASIEPRIEAFMLARFASDERGSWEDGHLFGARGF